jgi:hypothetical protein
MRPCNRDIALRIIGAGLAVFPARPDRKKRPLVKWRKNSSTNTETIERWWKRWPSAVPAIDLGKSDLAVLDGDRHGGPDGRAALQELLEQQSDFGGTAPIVETPSDGVHVYFSRNGHELTNSRGNLPPGIDIRAIGGYVIAPGAVLPDGKRYRAVSGTPDLLAAYQAGTIPHVPEGIVGLIRARRKQGEQQQQNSGADAGVRERAYAQATLEGCVAELSAAMPGSRNELANRLAFRLGRMVARSWVDRADVEAALLEALYKNGYIGDDGLRSAEATLRSGLDAGKREPHPDLSDRHAGNGGNGGGGGDRGGDGGGGGAGNSAEGDETPEADAAPSFSEEALALDFATRHADDLRHVALWGKWLCWDGRQWVLDETRRAFSLARLVCRDAAALVNKPGTAKSIASAKVRRCDQPRS